MAGRISVILQLGPTWIALAWWSSKAQFFWRTRPDLQGGWIIALLALWLFWVRLPNSSAPHPAAASTATATACFAALLGATLLLLCQAYHAVLGLAPANFWGMSLALACLAAANCLGCFGWRGLRAIALPLLLLALAIPLPSFLHHAIISNLQHALAGANTGLLHLAGIPATQAGNVIHLPHAAVGIDEACSGIRSLQSCLVAAIFLGAMLRSGWRAQTLLLMVALALALLTNLARSTFLCFTAYHHGPAGTGATHDSAGWVTLLVTTAGLLLCQHCLSRNQLQTRNATPGESPP